MIPIFIALMLSTLTGTAPVAPHDVQGKTIDGTWNVHAETVTGTLVIEKRGDRLTGRWMGRDGDVWPLNGLVDLARFEFTTDARDVTSNEHGRATTRRVRWTFRGENDHDTLRGTLAVHRDGEQPDAGRPFTATRPK